MGRTEAMNATNEKLNSIDSLTSEMEQAIDTGTIVTTELATSERIIARVTDGIYREPWAAFRELISNAYDADATRVVVETGAPDFTQVTVRDNGIGMSPNTVAYILKSIGGSSKRTSLGAQFHTSSNSSPDKSPAGRPLIGKIGIGLFAVAQLTQHFQIITKAAGELVRTSATIKLQTHDEQEHAESEGGYLAGMVSLSLESVSKDDIDDHGTAIVLYSLRPEISRSLQSIDRWTVLTDSDVIDGKPVTEPPDYHIGVMPKRLGNRAEGIEPNLPWELNDSSPEKFKKLVEAAENVSNRSSSLKNLDHFDNYLKLIWQLSLALPLKYPSTM